MKIKILLIKNGAYLFFLFVLFIFNSKLNSQIVYTDIIPDATPSATYPLDLNNDSIDDFLIQMGATNKIICLPQNNNAYSGEFVGGEYLAWALSSSNNICPSQVTWYDSTNPPGKMAWGTNIGHWVGVANKYLALKLIVGANTYYGWARLDVLATATSFTVKDYAYQSTPNTCIASGQTIQTTTGINENTDKPVFLIFPNPFNSSTTIQTTDNLKNATLTICNSFGQVVKQVKNISGQTVSLFRDNLPQGMYLVQLIEENKIITVQKLVITD